MQVFLVLLSFFKDFSFSLPDWYSFSAFLQGFLLLFLPINPLDCWSFPLSLFFVSFRLLIFLFYVLFWFVLEVLSIKLYFYILTYLLFLFHSAFFFVIFSLQLSIYLYSLWVSSIYYWYFEIIILCVIIFLRNIWLIVSIFGGDIFYGCCFIMCFCCGN